MTKKYEKAKPISNLPIYEDTTSTPQDKLKYISLIMNDYHKNNPYASEEKAGAFFNSLYEKSAEELKIYMMVFK